jgi:hypothetical protein
LHPKKSFLVQAPTPIEKEAWLAAIRTAVEKEQRKAPLERRLSLLPRLEGMSALELEVRAVLFCTFSRWQGEVHLRVFCAFAAG